MLHVFYPNCVFFMPWTCMQQPFMRNSSMAGESSSTMSTTACSGSRHGVDCGACTFRLQSALKFCGNLTVDVRGMVGRKLPWKGFTGRSGGPRCAPLAEAYALSCPDCQQLGPSNDLNQAYYKAFPSLKGFGLTSRWSS